MSASDDTRKEEIRKLQCEIAEMEPLSQETFAKKMLLRDLQLEEIDDPLERMRQMNDWSIEDDKERADRYFDAGDTNEGLYWKLSVMEEYMEAILFELRLIVDNDRF